MCALFWEEKCLKKRSLYIYAYLCAFWEEKCLKKRSLYIYAYLKMCALFLGSPKMSKKTIIVHAYLKMLTL